MSTKLPPVNHPLSPSAGQSTPQPAASRADSKSPAAVSPEGSSKRKLARQSRSYEMDDTTQRVYADALKAKEKKLAELEAKYYQRANAVMITEEQLKASLDRQVKGEMERRKHRMEQLKSSVLPTQEPKKLSQEDIEAMQNRIYNDAVKARLDREAKEEEHRKEITAIPPKKLTAEEQSAMASRLGNPKKRVLTEEEINKVLGLA